MPICSQISPCPMLTLHQFTVNPLQQNTYLLYNDEGMAAIIDPGFYTPAEHLQLSQYLSAHRLQLSAIWLTHAHFDHVFGLKQVAQQHQLVPQLHPNEGGMLQMASVAATRWNLPFEGYTGPVQHFQTPQSLSLGSHNLQVINCPGHSPGHVAFYQAPTAPQHSGILIAGDTLFSGSIGRTDLPGGNHAQLLQSIHQQLLTLPLNTRVYPGHGPATTIGTEKIHNPYLA
ncbi:MAG: MBL fold metallo-hydrolase [Bacteroidetes bacterium]|nr:MAG: MBL fold metallo-hydrolase [Bacteroidota bacterium]